MRRYLLAGLVTFAVGAPAHAQTLDQQEHCAMQAKQVFQGTQALEEQCRIAGNDFQRGCFLRGSFPIPNDKRRDRVSAEYKSHYSKTGKCLVIIKTKDLWVDTGTSFDVANLMDANEQRQHAIYVQTDDPKAHHATPACELYPGLPEEKSCKTREKFDAFVAGHLTE